MDKKYNAEYPSGDVEDRAKDNKANMVDFLRTLATSIESGDLPQDQIEHIGEFYMKYKFQEQVDIDSMRDNFDKGDFTRDEFQKFLVMGWYFYRVLNRNDSVD